MFYPIVALVGLTYVVLVVNFIWRVKSVKSRQVNLRYYQLFEGDTLPHIKAGTRHYANLFELPVLFYAGCLCALVFRLEHWGLQTAAWSFVAARVAHAWIHMGNNHLVQRMTAFWCSVIALAALWLQLLVWYSVSAP